MRIPALNSSALCRTVCSDRNDAVSAGSGSLNVFATPSMIALMEQAAVTLLAPYLDINETSVGTYIAVTHSSPTGHGIEITARAEITEINGREITFSVYAADRTGEIGSGIHKRVIVNAARLLEKANNK